SRGHFPEAQARATIRSPAPADRPAPRGPAPSSRCERRTTQNPSSQERPSHSRPSLPIIFNNRPARFNQPTPDPDAPTVGRQLERGRGGSCPLASSGASSGAIGQPDGRQSPRRGTLLPGPEIPVMRPSRPPGDTTLELGTLHSNPLCNRDIRSRRPARRGTGSAGSPCPTKHRGPPAPPEGAPVDPPGPRPRGLLGTSPPPPSPRPPINSPEPPP